MDDLISRQAAIDVLKEKVFSNLTDEFYGAMQAIDELPSAQPECKTGQWIQLTCDSVEWWYCSECNGRVQMNPWAKYNYCPNCGIRIKRGE